MSGPLPLGNGTINRTARTGYPDCPNAGRCTTAAAAAIVIIQALLLTPAFTELFIFVSMKDTSELGLLWVRLSVALKKTND
jgi:hypothetical protein